MNELQKSHGLPETIDPGHQYIYKTGDHGLYQYWYRDMLANYWEYTNAPEGHKDYDPICGAAILAQDQPMPHTAPQFYTEEGYKRNIGIPDGLESQRNAAYDPANHSAVWFEVYQSQQGAVRYVYLDADVRENLDLWVQQQLRIVDAGLPAYRKYASNLALSGNQKDKVIGVILILVDQGLYDLEELIFASNEDLEFIDNTVKLLGRKFICDPEMLDFLTMLKASTEPGGPLFFTETVRGKEPIGIRHISSIFQALKMRAVFIRHWHANHIFSRIIHRLSLQQIPAEEVEELALNELARVFATPEDVSHLLDYKLRDTLINNYDVQDVEDIQSQEAEGDQKEETPDEEAPQEGDVQKSLTRVSTDDFGVNQVWIDLVERRADEREFSSWLQSEPMHDMTPQEEAAKEELELTAESEEENPEEDAPEEEDV